MSCPMIFLTLIHPLCFQTINETAQSQQQHSPCLLLLHQNMKQIITLNFGQSGINISDQTLTLYLKEHGLHRQSPLKIVNSQPSPLIEAKCNPVFFEQTSNDSVCYRSISVDCDPYSSDELLRRGNKMYYKKSRMISSKQSTGGIYSRGFAISNRQLCSQLEQSLQKTLDACDNLQGIIINVSMLGGASGIFHHVMSKIMGEEYLRKKIAVCSLLFPSASYGNSIVQNYNYTLSFQTLLEYSHLNIPFDNESIYRRCEEAGIENPGYNEINQHISNMQSSITLPMRSNGPLNCSLNELTTNLVCYPRINSVYPSCTPLINSQRMYNRSKSVEELTNDIFNPQSRLLDMHSVQNKIAIGLYYRGDVTPYEVFKSLQLKKESKNVNCVFEDWSPLGFKVGINYQQALPYTRSYSQRLDYLPNRSCCSLTSSMQWNKLLAFNNYKFDKLYAKRAFVYTFVQDMTEEGQLIEARQGLAALEKDYETWEGVHQYEEE